jgi:hypothetical protein
MRYLSLTRIIWYTSIEKGLFAIITHFPGLQLSIFCEIRVRLALQFRPLQLTSTNAPAIIIVELFCTFVHEVESYETILSKKG